MKKKYINYILLVFVVILLLIIILIVYFKPIKISYNIINNYKADLSLKRRLNSCLVTSKVDNDKLSNDIKKLLAKDGYILKKDTYVKVIKNKKTCDFLKEQYESNNNDFELKGNKNENLEVNTSYEDKGYTLESKGKIVNKISDIDVKKLGNQYVIYKLEVDGLNRFLIRQVTIKDTTKPVIELKGKAKLKLYLGDKSTEPGYVATDNYDGDITDKVTTLGTVDSSKEGEYELTYKVVDSSGNETEAKRIIVVKQKVVAQTTGGVSYVGGEASGLTFIKGILVVNKKYGLPKDYNPGVNPGASAALSKMQADASVIGLSLKLVSGYRSYQTQYNLYNKYVSQNGQAKADTFSARPGHSEHQTGLSFDVGSIKGVFANTDEAKWLSQNCYLYGFIIRYPKGKTSITGYVYEPWHIRYLGVETATSVKNSGLTLEEYLGIN